MFKSSRKPIRAVSPDRAEPECDRYLVTTNCGLLFNVPDGVTTETVPVVAPAGTVAWM
jgi:hypothetical protein